MKIAMQAETSFRNELEGSGVFMVDIDVEEGGSGETEFSKASTGSALATVYRLSADLHEAGVLDKATMKHFDELCLTPVQPMDGSAIQETRIGLGMSQAYLAKVLNVTTNAVGPWERGEKKPTGSALKLLALLREKGLSAVL